MELLNLILSKQDITLLDSLLVIAVGFEGGAIAALAACIVHLYKRERECNKRFIALQKELIRRGYLRDEYNKNDKHPPSGGASVTPVYRQSERG